MITININDAPAMLPDLFAKVLAGENVVFCKDSLPVMELKPVQKEINKIFGKRILGNPPFPMEFSDDVFDPLPEDMWNVFKDSYEKL